MQGKFPPNILSGLLFTFFYLFTFKIRPSGVRAGIKHCPYCPPDAFFTFFFFLFYLFSRGIFLFMRIIYIKR